MATEVDGTPEALEYGEAGLLVSPSDDEALADVVTDVLAHPTTYAYLKTQTQANLAAYRLDAFTDQIDTVYQELL